MGLSTVAVTESSDIVPVSSKEFLDIQETIEYGFTLECVRDMIRTYSQLDLSDGLATNVRLFADDVFLFFLLSII